MKKLHNFNTLFATIHKIFHHTYGPFLDVITTMLRRHRFHVLVIPRMINDLNVFLRHLRDWLSLELGEFNLQELNPFTLSIVRVITPWSIAVSHHKRIANSAFKVVNRIRSQLPRPLKDPRATPSTPDFFGTTLEAMIRSSDMQTRMVPSMSRIQFSGVTQKGILPEVTQEIPTASQEKDVHDGDDRRELRLQMERDASGGVSQQFRSKIMQPLIRPASHQGVEVREGGPADGTRIQSPLRTAYTAALSSSEFLGGNIPKAVPPRLPHIVKRIHEMKRILPRWIDEELQVWLIPAVRQTKTYGASLFSRVFALTEAIATGLTNAGHQQSMPFAGMRTIETLRLEPRITMKPLERRSIAESSGGAIAVTHLMGAIAAPHALAREGGPADGTRIRSPLRTAYTAALSSGRRLRANVTKASVMPYSLTRADGASARARGMDFSMAERIKRLFPIPFYTKNTLERMLPQVGPSPTYSSIRKVETELFKVKAMWREVTHKASQVAGDEVPLRSPILRAREQIAQQLAIIQPFVRTVTASAQRIPSSEELIRKASELEPVTRGRVNPLKMVQSVGMPHTPWEDVSTISSRAFNTFRLLPKNAIIPHIATKNAIIPHIATKNAITQHIATTKTIESIMNSARAHQLFEKYALERVLLDNQRTISTVKLQELASLLSMVRAAPQPSQTRAPRIEPVKSVERPRSIEVKVDALRDERDIRELRRKITRILREEARRYGVF
jgi:hypothetical protein